MRGLAAPRACLMLLIGVSAAVVVLGGSPPKKPVQPGPPWNGGSTPPTATCRRSSQPACLTCPSGRCTACTYNLGQARFVLNQQLGRCGECALRVCACICMRACNSRITCRPAACRMRAWLWHRARDTWGAVQAVQCAWRQPHQGTQQRRRGCCHKGGCRRSRREQQQQLSSRTHRWAHKQEQGSSCCLA